MQENSGPKKDWSVGDNTSPGHSKVIFLRSWGGPIISQWWREGVGAWLTLNMIVKKPAWRQSWSLSRVGYSVAIANNMAEAFLSCFIPQGYLKRFPPHLTCLKSLFAYSKACFQSGSGWLESHRRRGKFEGILSWNSGMDRLSETLCSQGTQPFFFLSEIYPIAGSQNWLP